MDPPEHTLYRRMIKPYFEADGLAECRVNTEEALDRRISRLCKFIDIFDVPHSSA